jgi:hypothetical protein
MGDAVMQNRISVRKTFILTAFILVVFASAR